jgi:hypothetical protein
MFDLTIEAYIFFTSLFAGRLWICVTCWGKIEIYEYTSKKTYF